MPAVPLRCDPFSASHTDILPCVSLQPDILRLIKELAEYERALHEVHASEALVCSRALGVVDRALTVLPLARPTCTTSLPRLHPARTPSHTPPPTPLVRPSQLKESIFEKGYARCLIVRDGKKDAPPKGEAIGMALVGVVDALLWLAGPRSRAGLAVCLAAGAGAEGSRPEGGAPKLTSDSTDSTFSTFRRGWASRVST